MSLGGLGDEDIEDTDISGYFCVAVCGELGMHLFWMQFKSIFFYMEPNTGLTITDCCSKTTVDSLRRITNIDRTAQINLLIVLFHISSINFGKLAM